MEDAQQALTQLRAELEIERGARLKEEAAHRETVLRLRQSAAEMEQFAYVASHDLRAPLRNIAGFSQLLSRRHKASLAPDAQEFLGFIDSSIRQMQMLIDDLLLYSRVGRIPESHLETLPLNSAVELAMASLQGHIQATGTVIHVDKLPAVTGDHSLLTQLICNLLDNAIKFQPPGQTPKINIHALNLPDAVRLTITDNGIGISKEHLDAIFAVFFRLHTQDEFEGTGIGLAICRKISNHHNSRIWAESAGVGTGTSFIMEIPHM